MPKFNYVAMDSRGKETKGTLDVGSQNEAISRLKEMGYFPTKVVEADKTKDKSDKKSKAVGAADDKGKKRSEEHTSELQSLAYLVCRLLLEKKKKHNRGQST